MHEAVAHSEVTDALAAFALAPVADHGTGASAALSQAHRAVSAARAQVHGEDRPATDARNTTQAYAALLASQGAPHADGSDARVQAWAVGAALSALNGATPSTASLAVAIVLGQRQQASDDAIVAAAAIGAEAAARVLAAVDDTAFRQRWNVSSSIGILGAVLTASRLLGLDRARTIHAIGLAATQAAGLAHNLVHGDGLAMAPIEVGKAAADAIEAALMAKHGFTSAAASIDGRRGLAALMAYRFDSGSIVDTLGERWISAE